MANELRNTTHAEAAVLLRLEKEGVHPTELETRLRQEIPLEECRRCEGCGFKSYQGNDGYEERVSCKKCAGAGEVCALIGAQS